MADENIIDDGGSLEHTHKSTHLTVEERKQVVASLLIGSTWDNETPKLAHGAVLGVAKKFKKTCVYHRSCLEENTGNFHTIREAYSFSKAVTRYTKTVQSY